MAPTVSHPLAPGSRYRQYSPAPRIAPSWHYPSGRLSISNRSWQVQDHVGSGTAETNPGPAGCSTTWRKNLPRLVSAFASARTHGLPTDAMLVIVANPTADAVAAAAHLGMEDALHFTGFCASDLLPHAYTCARLLVHPALLEGFGLPPLEAMACDTPVAASDAGSIPEVVGDSALLFDPFDVDEIAESICRLWWDEPLRRDLIARGRRHVGRYSWDSVATATRRALESAVEAHGRRGRPGRRSRAAPAPRTPR
jgi:glycosyltransferase involved in cell wall biosynthesis